MILLIGRSYLKRAIVLDSGLSSYCSFDSVVVISRKFSKYGITMRETEYDIVTGLDITESFKPSVIILYKSRI